MRRCILPLLISTASLGAALATSLGAGVPASGGRSEESDSRDSRQSDEETRALRQSLFKKPSIPFFDPQPRVPARTRDRIPTAPRVSRPLVISPPPVPRDISLAERELSLQPAAYTPYDRYIASVRTVISRLDPRGATMARATALMNEAHGFRYRSAHPYQAALPETTAVTRTGDCKGKSLWLYDRLGDPSAFYVIGKTFKGTASNHAWIYWRYDSQWWILDPTNRSAPVPADSLPTDRYVPYYSFGKKGAFRHRATWIFMAGSPPVIPAVATRGTKSRVARQ